MKYKGNECTEKLYFVFVAIMQSFPALCVLAVASVVTFVKGDLKLSIIKKRVNNLDSSIFRPF